MTTEIKILKKIQTAVSDIFIREDGIINVVIKDNIEIDIEQSREIFNTLKGFSQQPKDLLVLVQSGNYSTVTAEVREFSSSDEASSITFAEAIVLKSFAQKLLINVSLNFFKPKRHIKIFNDETEAVAWLHSWKEKM